MEFHAEKAFFKSDTTDPFTNLPLYVFDSNFLPDFSNTNYDKKIVESLLVKAVKRIIRRIPQGEYALVCFTSGFKNFNNTNNTWVTALKCFQLLPDELKYNMHRAYMVHESWLVRSFSSIVSNVVHAKLFKNAPNLSVAPDQRLVYCKDLTELSKYVDITKLRIGVEVYLYDLQFTEKLIIPYTVGPKSSDYQDYLDLINERVTSRLLTEGPKNELVFTKPGNAKRLQVLIDAIERGNYLDMSQWDIHVMGSLFLNTLRKYRSPLIPIDMIELPISDDLSYTCNIFSKIVNEHDCLDTLSKIFEVLLNMVEHASVTRHTSKSLSKAITPALCQEKVSIKTNDRLLIGQRFIKNLIENWDTVVKSVHVGYTPTKEVRMRTAPTPPKPRKATSIASSASSTSNFVNTSTKPEIKKRVQIKTPSTSHDATDITELEVEVPPPMPRRPQVESQRNVSGASVLSINSISSSESTSSLDEDLKENIAPPMPPRPSILTDSSSTEVDKLELERLNEANVLADVTASLNKLPKMQKKKGTKAETKFADGYSSMEGQRKVSKLAKLYEKRLMGIHSLNEMEGKNK
ncbi:CYFA0S05e05226g1_1 [Cyberlindnera fabianii]|uniref:CYFA0S05e05226g1_1 n=1 Tax=Cyberlindnera fabianii TaxID=36022 RepID=A0A061AZN5_CYBFA|nr:CYFA0S05e05226g1_1 [Cyberlindnera fabianii]